ncbi:finger CCCH domain-containing 15 [Octopus vulgaris]|uniref:Finger CCCH domain-containing 15 n=1 Tax=Octopus vulgaris TaxID=6645 RepID=A0AA36ALH0_OCTVU|nr:finger CCCH domain-containing 15 [Octopus vulgaris]
MPPKAKKPDVSKKTDSKKKEKIIEDKTFGLKNKKGAKQQKFIKAVTHQVKCGNQSAKKLSELEAEKQKKRTDKKSQLDELNLLFKPIQPALKGADPKSVLCVFFKQGLCTKGDKCKFSHDLAIERKGAKKNIYEDTREGETMNDWDQQKLEEVVDQKHGESNKAKPKTSIICRYFLDAVENSKYGWFWDCPNGNDKCIYRHCLPAGFILKKDQKLLEKKDEISLEELIEKERAALVHTGTKITLQTFLEWKERKKKQKIAAFNQETEKKKAEFKAGRTVGISGREMFEFNPDLITQDDEGAADFDYSQETSDEESEESYNGPVNDINTELFVATENDGSGGTRIEDIRKKTEENKLSEATALSEINGEEDANVQIDEDLFDAEDLDQLDEDLDTLEIED